MSPNAPTDCLCLHVWGNHSPHALCQQIQVALVCHVQDVEAQAKLEQQTKQQTSTVPGATGPAENKGKDNYYSCPTGIKNDNFFNKNSTWRTWRRRRWPGIRCCGGGRGPGTIAKAGHTWHWCAERHTAGTRHLSLAAGSTGYTPLG